MEYKIERTSLIFEPKERPCNKAYLKDGLWFIQINSLDELTELIKEAGCPIIVGTEYIEIYDDYRE